MLASVNLNRRLGANDARSRLASWLRKRRVQVLVAQEPFKPADRVAPVIAGFTFAGGDGHLAAWVSEGLAAPAALRLRPWAQRIQLDWLVILQVHLDAHASASRTSQLAELAELAAAEDGRPLLICGDFNLAPRAMDGLFGEETSTFTTEGERAMLQQLKREASLVDTTADEVPAFTFERVFAGKLSRFRCDLALISDHLATATQVSTDASARSAPAAFTDHSAILIDLPVALEEAEPDDVLFALSDLDGSENPFSSSTKVTVQPHKTAMSRQAPSPASRAVTEHLTGLLGVKSVLDHGCGRGADVVHYRSLDLDAEGFDPHEPFGWPRPDRRDFDLVTSMFVLNVLPDPWQRIQALKDAASFARPGGLVVVVTRSPEEITKAATHGGWARHHDGFWSSRGKGTFQRGITAEEITTMARRAGLLPADNPPALPLPGVCHAILAKPVA
nr:methyltransferase domain-containing protein [Streptomyces sp. SID4948]